RMFEYYEASVHSFPRQVDLPDEAEEALAMLDSFGDGIDFNQKRQDLIAEFDDVPAMKFHRKLRVDTTGWNGSKFWNLVDYMKENEATGGPVTDRMNELADDPEDSRIKDAAQMMKK